MWNIVGAALVAAAGGYVLGRLRAAQGYVPADMAMKYALEPLAPIRARIDAERAKLLTAAGLSPEASSALKALPGAGGLTGYGW